MLKMPGSVNLFGRSVDDRSILSMIPGAVGYGSHRVLLALSLAWFDSGGVGTPRLGTVYEFGMGDGSTPYIAAFCAANRITRACFDSNREWFSRFFEPGSEQGPILGAIVPSSNQSIGVLSFPDWDQVPLDSMGVRSIDVALVDHAPGERRKAEIARLRTKATFVVVHDTERDGAGDYQVEGPLNSYRYRLDDYPDGAGTTVVSDFIDVGSEAWKVGLFSLRSIANLLEG